MKDFLGVKQLLYAILYYLISSPSKNLWKICFTDLFNTNYHIKLIFGCILYDLQIYVIFSYKIKNPFAPNIVTKKVNK